MVTLIHNAKVITDGKIYEGYSIAVEKIAGMHHQASRFGKILAFAPKDQILQAYQQEEKEEMDLGGYFLSPGFIDIHCHGGDGFEFIDATEEAIRKAARLHAANGTSVLYPTISAASFDVYDKVLEELVEIKDDLGLEIPGVHLEGPYLSKEMCGAQNTSFIHEPWESEYKPLVEKYGSLIKRWTYAQELDKDQKFLHFLTEHGIVPSVGHAATLYEELLPAYEEGCRLITHFYSCTSSIVRIGGFRHLGIVEAGFLWDDMYLETISDNRHLPPELFQMIVKLKGTDKICLITDAIRPAGTQEGGRGFSGGIEYVVEDGVAKLADRSAFAGSVSTTIHLLDCVVRDGIALEDGVKMLTEVPAKVMELSSKGHIAPGYDAQFTVFDEKYQVRTDWN